MLTAATRFQVFNHLSRNISGTSHILKWDFNSRRHYAKPAISGIAGLGKKKLGKTGPMLEKKVLPVETDPVKLVNYCCGSNIKKEGEDIKLKDDSEYPDWLWTLNTGPPIPLEQLDPDTDEYWERAYCISKKRLWAGGFDNLLLATKNVDALDID